MIFQKFSKRQTLAMTWWNQPDFKDRDGIICDGSVRSGKTLSMGIGFVIWAMTNFDNTNFAICGKTIAAVRRNVVSYLPTWLEGICSIKENFSQNKLTVTMGSHTTMHILTITRVKKKQIKHTRTFSKRMANFKQRRLHNDKRF